MLYERILSEYNRLDSKIHQIKDQISHLPAGKLICSKNQTRYKWYQSDGHQKTYIPKCNRALAEKLAVKKYLSLQLQSLEQEKIALRFYLNHHKSRENPEQLLTESSEYQSLLSPYFKPLSQELSDWQSKPYESNPLYPERLVHASTSGNLLRSKSESMIDMCLHVHKIPFRYECALHLGETTIYPDFTIRHPETGEIYYWEHFGMMDNPNYSSKVGSKLQLYISNGIIPSINLITTYETQRHPLSFEMIEKMINYYFL